MREKIIIALISIIGTAIITLIGTPYIEQKLQEKRVPVLVSGVYRPDISGLSATVQSQVTLLPVKYSLMHQTGGTAKNVTVFLESDSNITPEKFIFDKESEKFTYSQQDRNTIRIDIPSVRPGGFVSFEVLTEPHNEIRTREIAAEGKIFAPDAFKVQASRTNWIRIGIVAIVIILWVFPLTIVLMVIKRVYRSWQNIEEATSINTEDFRSPLITLVVSLLIYDIIVTSLGPIGGFLPIVRVSFHEFFYAFSLYLLVTRYKLIDEALRKIISGKSEDSFKEKSKNG